MTFPILKFENVSYEYETEENNEFVPAVNNVSFSVSPGEFVAVLGHNGSGKSTLAKLSNSILLPTNNGKVFVCNMDTASEALSHEIRKTVGVVFQNPDNQIVSSVVEEDVAFGPENLGLPREEIAKRIYESLKAVGMEKYRYSEPHKLSGGQKQRVAIAGIIAMEPKCLVLDEPTAMLDPKGRQEVLNTVKKLNKEKNIAVLFITHYMEEAVLADRIIVMNDGKIIFDDSPKNVFKHYQILNKIGLDIPDVMKLSLKLYENGVNIDPFCLTQKELNDNLIKIIGRNGNS
ncbi:MAG: energy-coupling factor transporter ATPase [Candidatus Fimenecus sp.]